MLHLFCRDLAVGEKKSKAADFTREDHMKTSMIAVLFAVSACTPAAPGGQWRQNVHALTAGQSSDKDIDMAIGSKPMSIERTDADVGHFARMTYISGDIKGGEGRQIIVETKDGKYNGYRYVSTYAADVKQAKPSQSYTFVAGKTTRAEVKAALEPPTAVVHCPSTLVTKCVDDTEAWIWEYGQGQSVSTAFDNAGVVKQ